MKNKPHGSLRLVTILLLASGPVFADGVTDRLPSFKGPAREGDATSGMDRYLLRAGEKRTIRVDGMAEFMCEAGQQQDRLSTRCSGYCSCIVPVLFGSRFSGQTLYTKGEDEFDGFENLQSECKKLCEGMKSPSWTLYRQAGSSDAFADPQNSCN